MFTKNGFVARVFTFESRTSEDQFYLKLLPIFAFLPFIWKLLLPFTVRTSKDIVKMRYVLFVDSLCHMTRILLSDWLVCVM